MKIKAGNHACESVVKLLLCSGQTSKLTSLNKAQISLISQIGSIDSAQNIDKIFGYVLSLNFNKQSYLGLYFQSLATGFDGIEERLIKHANAYHKFIEIDSNGQSDPYASSKRRTILQTAELLLGHLQRDPEEAVRYDQQMLSARNDKQRLLQDVDKNETTRLIDIGPAGGATFRDVVALGGRLTSYFGIEFDVNELRVLNELLTTYKYKNVTAEQQLNRAKFVEGNALDLASHIEKLKVDFPLMPEEKLSIILSSVIHSNRIFAFDCLKSPSRIITICG